MLQGDLFGNKELKYYKPNDEQSEPCPKCGFYHPRRWIKGADAFGKTLYHQICVGCKLEIKVQKNIPEDYGK